MLLPIKYCEKNQRSCPSSVCLPLMVMKCDPVMGVLKSFQRKHPAHVASPVQKAFVILKNLLCSYILAKHYLNEWVNEWISQWTNSFNTFPLYEHTKRITWPVLFVLNVLQDLNFTSAFKIRLAKREKCKMSSKSMEERTGRGLLAWMLENWTGIVCTSIMLEMENWT